jgi:hypothetical protein
VHSVLCELGFYIENQVTRNKNKERETGREMEDRQVVYR